MSSGAVHASAAMGRPLWWASHGGDPNTPCAASSYWWSSNDPAKPLGAWYQGMEACGPIPDGRYGNGDYTPVYTSSGSWSPGWQCVQLSERWLTLVYRLRAVN